MTLIPTSRRAWIVTGFLSGIFSLIAFFIFWSLALAGPGHGDGGGHGEDEAEAL